MPNVRRPIRIAFVSHQFKRNDGQGRVNYEVVRAALDRGFLVTVLATHCSDDLRSYPNCRVIELGSDKLPTAMLRTLVFAMSSARWLKAHRKAFDLVQCNGFVTWEDCDVAAAHFIHTSWINSKYYPFKTASPYAIYQRVFGSSNSRWERRVFTRAKRVIAVSKHIGGELETLGVPPDNIVIIPNGVDTTEFCPGRPEREQFGLPLNTLIGLFVGDIKTPRKNLDTVLKALQHVPDLHLAVAGAVDGSPYPAMARRLGIADRVTFMGKVSGIARVMRSVDMFVFPSRYEAHPLVVLEAMASGLPVIASGVFGAEEFLGSSGFILRDPNDDSELSDRMSSLIASEAMRRTMGGLGRELALQMQWSAMAAKYLDVYDSLFTKDQL